MLLRKQFSEPHKWWDLYEAEIEESYKQLIHGKTCLDCAKCVNSEKYPCGYCTEDGEMRYETDSPEKDGMDCFEDVA